MTKLFVIALALVQLSSKGQYFQHVYGDNTSVQILTDGHNAYSGGSTGHFLVGHGNNFLLNVQRTDIDGRITGPQTFNNSYYLTHIVNPPAMPADQTMTGAQSLEFSNGSGFAIAGSYSSAGHLSIFYVHMNPNGSVITSTEYIQSIPKVTYADVHVQGITESLGNPGDLYITGYYTQENLENKAFAIKINQAGALLWGVSYNLTSNAVGDSDIPYDILETNYVNPSCGCNEVVIVGQHTNNTNIAAFVLRVNSSNGGVLQSDFYTTGIGDRQVVFSSIKQSANTNVDPNGEGFIITGHQLYPNCDSDMWFVALNKSGAIVWDHLFNNYQHSWGTDLIERFNSSGTYEYYLLGMMVHPYQNTSQIIVIKTDEFGNLVSNGRFLYGQWWEGRTGAGVSIDQLNGYGSNTDGISIYGTTPDFGGYQHFLVKAYFDGITTCRYWVDDAVQTLGSTTRTNLTPQERSRYFRESPLLAGVYQHLNDIEICWSMNEGGSNDRFASADPKGEQEATIAPNPMTSSTTMAMVEFETRTPETVQVTISDMLGKLYYTGDFPVIQGKNQLPVDLTNANMVAGIYSVKITSASVKKSSLLIIK